MQQDKAGCGFYLAQFYIDFDAESRHVIPNASHISSLVCNKPLSCWHIV